jgi:ADP-ribose pyrophosphatase YjhB (NUDIX family)
MSSIKTARLTLQPQGQQSEEVMHVSSFAIVKKRNELLLVKRIRPEFSAGKWVFPSAIINFGEHPESAIKRIVKEQIGAEPKNVKLIDIQSYGDKHWDLCFVYEISIDEVGKVSPDIEKAEYFDRGKLPPEFRSDNAEVLQGLGSKV